MIRNKEWCIGCYKRELISNASLSTNQNWMMMRY